MIALSLYTLHKRVNSLKRPTGEGYRIEGELKEDFSITGFSVRLALAGIEAPLYNYAHIAELSRYYYITDWTYRGGYWYATLAVDVLASNAEAILSSTQYVTRAASLYNPSIVDDVYPTIGGSFMVSSSIPAVDFWGAPLSTDGGIVVLGTIGDSPAAIGSTCYYGMTMPTYRSLAQSMLGSVSWAGISGSEISEGLQKALINPSQYIVSCRWYPLPVQRLYGLPTTTSVSLGWWNFQPTGTVYMIPSPWDSVVEIETELDIPKHPQASARREFLRVAPYSTYQLKINPFGSFDIDSTALYEASVLNIKVTLSLLTGEAVLRATTTPLGASTDWSNTILYVSGVVGASLIVGQVAGDLSNYKNVLIGSGIAGIAGVL